MFTDLPKADDEYFFATLKKKVEEAQEIYGLILEKMPKREYVHDVEDAGDESEI